MLHLAAEVVIKENCIRNQLVFLMIEVKENN